MGFDSTRFGSVTFNGKRYGHDIIVKCDGSVIKRPLDLGTHQVSENEARLLLEGEPEVVVIGSGQSGVLDVSERVKKMLEKSAKLVVQSSPKAIKIFNKLDKRKSILVHTTC